MLPPALLVLLVVWVSAPEAVGQQVLGGDYDAPVGGYCRGPGGAQQGVNGLSCPGVADLATCQRGCDLNRPRCIGFTWRPHSDRRATDLNGNGIIDPEEYSQHDHSLCSIKGAGLVPDPSWIDNSRTVAAGRGGDPVPGGCRQVTGQADLIAYGSHSVGGGTDGVDAEAICVTCADHTPGEEVTFDPLGKGADGSFHYQGPGRDGPGGAAEPNDVDCTLVGLAQVTSAHCPAAKSGERVPASCPHECAQSFASWNTACHGTAAFRQADEVLDGQLVGFAAACLLAPADGGGH